MPCTVSVAKVLCLNDSRGSLSDSAAFGSNKDIDDWSSIMANPVIALLVAGCVSLTGHVRL